MTKAENLLNDLRYHLQNTPASVNLKTMQVPHGSEMRSARRQNLKLAWEDAWNHTRLKLSVKWLFTDLLGHDAVTCGTHAENHFTIVSLL